MDKKLIKQDRSPVVLFKNSSKGFRGTIDVRALARQVLIRGENKREFYDFAAQLSSELPCLSKIEEQFLEKYIFSAWKLKRMRQLERNLLNKQRVFSEEQELFSNTKRRVRNISHIRLSQEIETVIFQQEKLEKQMAKALKQLREEQRSEKPSGNEPT
jgi:hypothetical protein